MLIYETQNYNVCKEKNKTDAYNWSSFLSLSLLYSNWCQICLVFSKNLILNRADVLRENAEAVFAACDAAHGRWAKLLGVRAVLHPKLKLQEFLTIFDITQEFITATEKVCIHFFLANRELISIKLNGSVYDAIAVLFVTDWWKIGI